MTVVFTAQQEPLGHSVRRALQAAEAMQAAMVDFAAMATSVGPLALGMKIGIGAGEALTVQLGGVGKRWEYVVAGDLLRQAARAEGQAGRGEVILSTEARRILSAAPLAPRPLERPGVSTRVDPAVLERLAHFIPPVVLGWQEKGLRDWLAVLRPMTVLFIGIDGLDYDQPEAPARLHYFLQDVQRNVARYEGTINKLAVDDKGTILLVLLGAPPYAHEDDALRATRCALELQALATGSSLRLFIGITTGQLFAGPVGSETRREYTVMGDAVNLAARLMGVAREERGREGGCLSDFDTYSRARGQVAFVGLAPVRVKGKAGLVRVYRPHATATVSSPVEDRGPLVGRKAEMARFEAALEGVSAGQSRVLIVEGEAGIGKSRLVAELMRSLRERGLAWLLGAGQSIEQGTPYRAWRDILSFYFGLAETDSPAERRERVRALLLEVAPEQEQRLPLLNDVLSLGLPESELTASLDPALRQQSLFALLLTLLRAWARDHPLVLILEDAHWLDSLSWELAVYIARALTASRDPVFIALVMRPPDKHGAAEQHVAALRALEVAETLVLSTLEPAETVALVTTRLGLPEGNLPPAVADLVRQRSEGNPFFAEELVFTLRDQGVIQVDPASQRCLVSGNLELARQTLPGTVQGLILARIDRLPPERQLVLKVASVIGRTFSFGTLVYTLNQHTAVADAALKEHLDALATLGLTPLSAPEPDLSYTFKHIITQEAAYGTLLFAQRRQLHRTVAQWYEVTFGPPADAAALSPYYPLLAHHYREAQDQEKERRYAQLAGRQAADRFANAEAVAYLTRAFELTPEQETAERYNLLLAREKVYDLQGARAAQSQDLDVLRDMADKLDDGYRRAEVLLAQAAYAESTGNFGDSIERARAAVELARRAHAAGLEAAGLMHWGRTLWRQGDYEGAQSQVEEGMSLALAAGLRKLEEDGLRSLGIIAAQQGDLAGARPHFARALEISREIGDRRGESAALNNLGIVAHRLGDAAGFAGYSEQALHTYEEIGDRRGQGWAHNNLGVAAERLGDHAGAREHYERALAIFAEVGDQMGTGAALSNIGTVSHRLGDYSSARKCCEQALEICRKIGDREGEGEALTYLALLQEKLGSHESAREYSQEALAVARELGDGSRRAQALTYMGHALAGLGQSAESAAAYQQAMDIRREGGEADLAIESLAGLCQVTLAQGRPREALPQAEEIYRYLQSCPLPNTTDPFELYLACYRALRADDDPRARPLLETAGRLLREQAGRIADEGTRRMFLEGIAVHREIIFVVKDFGPTAGTGS